MKKIVGMMLAVLLLFGVVLLSAPNAYAASNMKMSAAGIDLLKQEEGFSQKPYWDVSQYTVGYGTKCPSDMLKYYQEHGITVAEAETLLRNDLTGRERRLNSFIDTYNLKLQQHQFDALMLMTYNCGTGWMSETNGTFHQAIKNGVTGNDLVRAFCLWCVADGEVQTFLLRRRLSEVHLYTTGQYMRYPPANYCYVIYNPNGGTTSLRSQGYNSDLPAAPLAVPSYPGHTFLGWYTQRSGGQKVTELNASTKNMTLYAHWVDGEGNLTTPEFTSLKIKVTATKVNLRSGPGTGYSIVGQANPGRELVITEVASSGGLEWGKFDGGWICLQYTNFEEALSQLPSTPDTDTPDNDDPNGEEPNPDDPNGEEPNPDDPNGEEPNPDDPNGEEPNPDDPNGEEPNPDDPNGEEPNPDDPNGEEPNPDDPNGEEPNPDDPNGEEPNPDKPDDTKPQEPTTWTGTVKVSDLLRVRSEPVTGAVTARLKNGTKVVITEKKEVNGTVWGKISQGWISLDYVVLDPVEETPDPDTPNPDEPNPDEPNPDEPNPDEPNPDEPNPDEPNPDEPNPDEPNPDEPNPDEPNPENPDDTKPQEPTTWTGTVKVNDYLNVRKAPVNGTVVASLKNGAKVVITEKKTVSGKVWGKIQQGWICLDYVVLDPVEQAPDTPADKPNTDTTEPSKPQEPTTWTGTVKVSSVLYVRKGAGTNYGVAARLKNGAKVVITEKKTVSGKVWGKVAQGWICLDYVVLDKTETSGSTQPQATQKTVTASSLCIRQNAGTGYKVVGYYYRGAKVTITETKTVSGVKWGKTAKGWICLSYTK